MSRTKKNTPGGNKKPKQKKEKKEKKEAAKTKMVVNVDEKLAESEDKSTKSVAVVEKKVEEEVKEVKEVGKKVPHPATLSPYRLDEAQVYLPDSPSRCDGKSLTKVTRLSKPPEHF